MGTVVRGPIYLPGGRDKEGFRTWTLKHIVISDSLIGPAQILLAPGLPQPGQMYQTFDDIDPWAFCTLEARVTPLGKNGRSVEYEVEQPFSSNPNVRWCRDQQIDDPLLQPPKISGNFVRYNEEATFDRFGNFLQNSAHEQIRGPQVEFDADRIQIEIEQNVINLDLPLLTILSNTVNAYPLWGVAPRVIKFTPGQWSMNFYGLCYKYFTRKLIFEAKKDGWDRTILDEGTKVLAGDWNVTGPRQWNLRLINGEKPDHKNPAHFIRYKDPDGNQTRVILDGAGKPFIPDLLTMVTGCSKQPKSPSKWLMSGIVNDNELKTPVVLSHAGDCVWSASWEIESGTFKLITLQYIPLDPLIPNQSDEWRITIEGITFVWTLKSSRWKNLGPNTLSSSEDVLIEEDYPPKFTLTTGYSAGTRSIQKYEQTDFLLLGIPINL